MREVHDIGTVEALRIDVLSETGWFDDARFKADMAAGGGPDQSQYRIAWDPENAGGYAALLTLTLAGGEEKRILLDSGWDTAWLDHAFHRHGVDRLLEAGAIDVMVLSHWHLDHFWGIETTLKHAPHLPLYAPATWKAEDRALLQEGGRFEALDAAGRAVLLCKNDVRHEGPLTLLTPEGADGSGLTRLFPGVALKMFPVSMLLRVEGEVVVYVHVRDKGLVTVTGCGHPGIMTLLAYARDHIAAPALYGCYGGLHLSLFDTWKPEFDQVIDDVKTLGLRRMACNHCTGRLWAEKAARHGVPLVQGTDAYLAYPKQPRGAGGSRAFLGNGDHILF